MCADHLTGGKDSCQVSGHADRQTFVKNYIYQLRGGLIDCYTVYKIADFPEI